ncbi:Pyruvate:ferredoxin oxidoreductase, alpha subunit [hydrothermal vent metagenome]|uniref:Pyruvate:ferredoxin oxidoreductase, alpha subunit n=1 Tax=hydrothermal vent metagenome TaxID=652676 RepID=A0A3B1E579_9ZZZZ
MSKEYKLDENELWDGNTAGAHAFRQANLDVVAAYPITPSTALVEAYGNFKANGYVDGEYVMVESEHAAMSACVGAAAAGGRVATATSSQGFAFMVEVLYQASGMRLPIVLELVNRGLAAPLNVNIDHGDMYLSRDTGWLSLGAFNPQEVYDFTLMAFKISEEARLPMIVNQDGLLTSHTVENTKTLPDDEAYRFVGEYKPVNPLLSTDRPITYGAQTEENWHFEHKARQHHDMIHSREIIDRVFKEFKELTGREYKATKSYLVDDAEIVIVCLGSTFGTACIAADSMRKQGVKAGVYTHKIIRPFPLEDIAKELSHVKVVAVLDRSSPGGAMGAFFNEYSGAFVNSVKKPILCNYIYGLGGRDTTVELLEEVYVALQEDNKAGKLTHSLQRFIGLRGPDMSFYDIGEK